MTLFVIIYNRTEGTSEIRQFDGPEASARALSARFEAERHVGPNTEVATLSADSLDDLKVTHSRYFKNGRAMLGDLAGAVS